MLVILAMVAVALAILLAIILVVISLIKRSGSLAGKTATIDTIVGEKCVVTETIDNFAGCGQVKVKGQLWSARGLFDDDVFEKGESLRIIAIEGVRAVCRKD